MTYNLGHDCLLTGYLDQGLFIDLTWTAMYKDGRILMKYRHSSMTNQDACQIL